MLVKGEKKEYWKMMLRLEKAWPTTEATSLMTNTVQKRKDEGDKAERLEIMI